VSNNIKLLKQPILNTEDIFNEAKLALFKIGESYSEAERYCKSMKESHNDLKELFHRVSEIHSLVEAGDKANINKEELSDELESIKAAVIEIVDAVQNLKEGIFNSDSVSIEEIENEPEYVEAKKELERDDEKFMKAYFYHKSRLNLNTQDDVARLTGLDRRQVSNLETSKHKPQFKTIKKIAEAFRADISEFI
jgi:DNA-binding XRE family transcriptional regulator